MLTIRTARSADAVAILEVHRAALLAELERLAFQICDRLTCDASRNAVPFYASHGYIEEARVEHKLSSGPRIACIRMSKCRP